MTTEVSSKAAIETHQQQQQQSASEEQEPSDSKEQETQPEGSQQVAEVSDKGQDQDTTTPANGGPTHPGEAEKEQSSGSKGLSRFLPAWLKRPRSQVSEEESGKETGAASSEENTAAGKRGLLNSVDQTEEEDIELIEIRAPTADQESDDKIEIEGNSDIHSLSSAETQPAQEEKQDDSIPEIKEEIKGEILEEKEAKSPERENQGQDLKSLPKVAKKSKTMRCKVTLLDETEFECEVEKHSKGHELFTKVCDHLNLLEKDYFGLAIWDSSNQRIWLDLTKEIKKQVQGGLWDFIFNVKFYPPDPAQLTEDITRYYLCLQLRQDIVTLCLPCSFVTLALLGSYTIQSELGEYDPDVHGTSYLSEFKLAPNQTKELEEKIMELHKTHRAMTPAQADLQFLENAKKLSMYGVDFHPAKDLEGVDIMLGVCSGGLLVYKDRLRINRFAWPKVLKISYKRSSFFIKIRPGEDQCESTVGFKLPNYRAAKKLWKVCVEHHTFFRLTTPEGTPKSKFPSLGSKFRYSGRTQAQTREASALIDRPAPRFERTASKRASRSLDGAKPKFPKVYFDISAEEDSELGCTDAFRQLPAAVVETPDKSPQAATATSAPTISQSHSVEASSAPTVQTTRVADSKAAKDEVKTEGQQEETIITKREPEPTQAVKIIPQQAEARATTVTTHEKMQNEGEEEVVRMRKKRSKKIEGENIYIRHSNLMLEDLDKTQDEIMKHHASISELKRSFMESVPEPRPSEWDKRLSAHSPFRTLNINGQVQSGTEGAMLGFGLRPEKKLGGPERLIESLYGHLRTSEKPLLNQGTYLPFGTPERTNRAGQTPIKRPLSYPFSQPQNVDDNLNSELEEQSECVRVDHNAGIEGLKEEVGLNESQVSDPPESAGSIPSSVSSSEEEEEEEDELYFLENEEPKCQNRPEIGLDIEASEEVTAETVSTSAAPQANSHMKEGEEILKLNGDMYHCHEPTQLIRCFQPPLVKTQTVTISDVSNAENEIATKEVPVVHTETKTITYEAAQLEDGNGELGVLMSAQTITSETVSTTTTTQITKTVKGGISETRIEKRIVITGDTDVDHDQALAQAIKEAKEQHPDMSVTKVVVHQETELAEEE